MIGQARATAAIAVVADVTMVVLALMSLFFTSFFTLVAWEVAAVVYLLATGVVIRYRAQRGTLDPRTGILSTLSWVVPLATSLAGVNSAFIALVGQTYTDEYGQSAVVAVGLGVSGIVLSWLMLHVAFVHIYMVRYSESAVPALSFPEDRDPDPDPSPDSARREPGYPEIVYFAFTIGATFATSDVEVRTRRMRAAVTVHSVWSFFYNALVVAIAFQVLQKFALQ